MKTPFTIYKGYSIHKSTPGYTVEHPTLGDRWFYSLHTLKLWVDSLAR